MDLREAGEGASLGSKRCEGRGSVFCTFASYCLDLCLPIPGCIGYFAKMCEKETFGSLDWLGTRGGLSLYVAGAGVPAGEQPGYWHGGLMNSKVMVEDCPKDLL